MNNVSWWWKYWVKPYPGHGPWSHLPPWERPGWWFGRGWCWWYWARPYPPWVSKEEELKYLEELRKYLSEEILREIDKRIEELRGT